MSFHAAVQEPELCVQYIVQEDEPARILRGELQARNVREVYTSDGSLFSLD